MRTRTIAAATVGLAALAGVGAQAAQASTLSVDAACYLSGQQINSTAVGFTPGGQVNFSFDGQVADFGTADTSGNLLQPLTAPLLPSNTAQHTFNLAAQDQTNPALTANIPVNVTERVASVSPRRARPSRKVTFKVHAMNPGQPVWLHYIFHGKQRYRKKLGTAKAPCGSVTKRTRFFPISKPKVGTWTFQFDDSKRYSKKSQPQFRGPVQIFNVFK
jgi:hypothetical protein